MWNQRAVLKAEYQVPEDYHFPAISDPTGNRYRTEEERNGNTFKKMFI